MVRWCWWQRGGAAGGHNRGAGGGGGNGCGGAKRVVEPVASIGAAEVARMRAVVTIVMVLAELAAPAPVLIEEVEMAAGEMAAAARAAAAKAAAARVAAA